MAVQLIYEGNGNFYRKCDDCDVKFMDTEYGYICPECNHKIGKE